MNWIFLALCVVFAIPPLWTWQKIKSKEPVKMTRKTFLMYSGLSLAFLLCYVALAFSKNAIFPVIIFTDIAFFISLVLAIYYAIKSKKQKEAYKNKLRNSFIATIGFFALFAFLVVNLSGIDSNNSASKETKQDQRQSSIKPSSKKKQSSSSNNKKEKSQKSDGYTTKQLKVINKQLVKDLKEDQKFATDGNSNYDYANYVLKINLENKTAAKVWVDGSFDRLSDEAKTEVGKKTIKLIQTSIVTCGINLSTEDEQNGIRLSVWNGPQFEGHSKSLNTSEFKWK